MKGLEMGKRRKVCCEWNRKPKNAPDANTAYEIFEDIKKRRGGITPQLLLIESKKKKSPFHNCFECDDSKAAEEYRIVQAHEIMRFLIIVIEPEDEKKKPLHVRAIVPPISVEKEDTTSWVTIQEVRNDVELSAAYKRQIKCELDAVKNKAKGFDVFSPVVEAIEAIKI